MEQKGKGRIKMEQFAEEKRPETEQPEEIRSLL